MEDKFAAARARAAKYGFNHVPAANGGTHLVGVSNGVGAPPSRAAGTPAPPRAPAVAANTASQPSAQPATPMAPAGLQNLIAQAAAVPYLAQATALLLPLAILRLSYVFPYRVTDEIGQLIAPSWSEHFWVLVATLGWLHRLFGLPDGLELLKLGTGLSIGEEKEDNVALVEHVAVEEPSSASSEATLVGDHPLLAQVPIVVDEFLKLATATPEDEWEPVVNAKEGEIEVKVWKYKKGEWCFKMVYDINAPLGPSLDISCDTLTRTSWDDMVDDTRVLETLDKYTRIEYVRAKAVFPTAARDVVLLSHLAAYPLDWAGEGQPTSFIHVTKSVDHARAPKPKGVVRMSTSVAGRLFTPLPNGGTRSLQIADLNPGGNVPAWVVNFVASKAVPKSVGTMYARMKQVGWTANQPSKMWEEGLAGKDWTPRARGKDEAAVEQPAVEALAPVEDKEERGGVLSAVGSAIVAVGSAAGSAVQGVHDALAWSSPFLLTAAAVAVAIAARDGGIKVEIGPRRR